MTGASKFLPTRPDFDLEAVRGWLDAGEVTARGGPSGGGYSGETLFLEADGRAVVLRTAPLRRAMFAQHDLSAQVRCMQHAGRHGLPVPEIVATDLDGTVLGRPAYVMSRVPGRVPEDDRPVFTEAGFLAQASAADQAVFGNDIVDRIADLHRLPLLDGLSLGPESSDHLDWCRQERAAAQVMPTRPIADLFDRAERVLLSKAPNGRPHTLLWGDARPANCVVDDGFRIAAMLDWELAGTGAPEFDIAWMNEMNRMRAGGTEPPLPGMPTDEQVWRRWSERTGRAPEALGWHRMFAAYKVAVLMDLHLGDVVHRGDLPADHPVRTRNRSIRRLTALLTSEATPCD